jgi:general secretion pathway protein G
MCARNGLPRSASDGFTLIELLVVFSMLALLLSIAAPRFTDLVKKQYLRAIPADPVTGSTAWAVIPPPGDAERGVFDVAAPIVAPPNAPNVVPVDANAGGSQAGAGR